MSIINRICTFLFVLLLLAVGVGLVLDFLGWTTFGKIAYGYYLAPENATLLLIIGGVLVLVALIIILAKIFIRPPKTARIPASGDHDAVLITLSTLEDMVRKTALAIPGVSSVTAKVKSTRSGLIITAKIRVTYDDLMTAITNRLQDDIKLIIESSTTLPVRRVSVFVNKAAGETSADVVRERAVSQVEPAPPMAPMTQETETETETEIILTEEKNRE